MFGVIVLPDTGNRCKGSWCRLGMLFALWLYACGKDVSTARLSARCKACGEGCTARDRSVVA